MTKSAPVSRAQRGDLLDLALAGEQRGVGSRAPAADLADDQRAGRSGKRRDLG